MLHHLVRHPSTLGGRESEESEKGDESEFQPKRHCSPGRYSLIWVIRIRAAGQGMVFWPRCPKQV